MNERVNDELCWEAVIARDASWDGRFVTAVKTTGIYCRPSCTARHPLRQNVAFYGAPAEAEAAGFRPCKRCSPDTQAYEATIAEQACRYIEAHLDERVTLEQIGEAVGLSPQQTQRVFKRALGISPKHYAEARRLDSLKAQLKAGASVAEAVYGAGYGSSSRIYEGTRMGMTPAAYKKGGQAVAIDYTIAECNFGYVLVGATERGVCVVRLGDTPEDLTAELRRDFPAATLSTDNPHLAEWVDTLLHHLSGEQPHIELPLDIRATAFQQRVWAELRAIPYGEQRSYSAIAAAIGNPKATRAVANACANNPVAVVIPCHRVIREDGDLGGYRWGLARKAAILEQERHAFIAEG